MHFWNSHALAMRLAAALRERKSIIATALAAGLLLGAVYYFAAPRSYRAAAVLLVTVDVAGHRPATYVDLVRSATVLDAAVARMQELPPAARVDFEGVARIAWRERLARRLWVTQADDADLITVACDSADADAAPLLVDAVVAALAEFIKRWHKEHAAELFATLQRERLGLEQRLVQKRQALADARQRLRDEPHTSPAAADRAADVELAEIDVQRVTAMHEALARQIVAVESHQSYPPVRFDIVSPASGSSRPVWPRFDFVMLAALGSGLLLGVAIVVVLEATDDRFRSAAELRMRGGIRLLASVSTLPVCEGTGLAALQMHVDPHGADSEPFRTLRAALDRDDRRWARWTITSARAGDGKTTLLANLAVACASAGRRTLVVDADLRRGGLTKLLHRRGAAGLAELLAGSEPVGEAARQLVQATGVEQLDIIACGIDCQSGMNKLGGERMAQLIAWASDEYDRVLIDAPPLLAASDALVAGRRCDGIVLVMQPEVSRRRDVLGAAQLVADAGIHLAGFIANRVDTRRRGAFGGVGDYAYRYAEMLRAAVSPNDEAPAAAPPNSRTRTSIDPLSAPNQDVLPRRVA